MDLLVLKKMIWESDPWAFLILFFIIITTSFPRREQNHRRSFPDHLHGRPPQFLLCLQRLPGSRPLLLPRPDHRLKSTSGKISGQGFRNMQVKSVKLLLEITSHLMYDWLQSSYLCLQVWVGRWAPCSCSPQNASVQLRPKPNRTGDLASGRHKEVWCILL